MLASCIPQPAPSFESESPNARLEAIVAASNASDDESLTKLVAQLDADDPAARVLAITALRKRTGETLGYRAQDSDWRRHEAFARWETYLQERGASASPAAVKSSQTQPGDPQSIETGPEIETQPEASEVTDGE